MQVKLIRPTKLKYIYIYIHAYISYTSLFRWSYTFHFMLITFSFTCLYIGTPVGGSHGPQWTSSVSFSPIEQN